jgi:hypothetical protein
MRKRLDHIASRGVLDMIPNVFPPPDDAIEVGNQESKVDSPHNPDQRMHCGGCAANSYWLVRGMLKRGSPGWEIVPGFAVSPADAFPIWHVWVRRGAEHFDPTWIWCPWWKPGDGTYYALPGGFTYPIEGHFFPFEDALVKHLRKRASSWGVWLESNGHWIDRFRQS